MAIHDATVQFKWVPTISNIAAPTVAQLAAGTTLTKITNYGLPSNENTVDTSIIDSMYDTTDVGTSQVGPIEVTFLYEGNTAMTTLLVFRTAGYLVRSRTGLWTAGTKVEVYPAKIGRRRSEGYGRNTEQKFMVSFHVTSEPNEDATVAA